MPSKVHNLRQVHLYRTDWAKVSTDSDDSVDLPADATESALHNALTDMHRTGANTGSNSASVDNGSKPEDNSSQGDVKSVTCIPWREDLSRSTIMTGVVLQMLHQLKTLLLSMTVTIFQAPFLYPSALNCLTAACIGTAALWHGRAFALHKQDIQMQYDASP